MLATGYKADLGRVPYLPPLATAALDEHMQSVARPGLYLPGFTATADFGPFFGFVRGAPAAATLVARNPALHLGLAHFAHSGAVMLALCPP